jgi:hypothetical protein
MSISLAYKRARGVSQKQTRCSAIAYRRARGVSKKTTRRSATRRVKHSTLDIFSHGSRRQNICPLRRRVIVFSNQTMPRTKVTAKKITGGIAPRRTAPPSNPSTQAVRLLLPSDATTTPPTLPSSDGKNEVCPSFRNIFACN